MRFFASIFVILLIFSFWSSKPSLELTSSSAEIRTDRSGGIGIMTGEKEGEIIQPITLSYTFVLKNTGKTDLGGIEKLNQQTYEYDDGIKVYIEPNEKLQEVTEEVMGFNIFIEEEREQAGLGFGETGTPLLKPNQEKEYTIDFDLGALEENPEIRMASSSEQLDKLKKNAMDAMLIIVIEDEEIARFNLKQAN